MTSTNRIKSMKSAPKMLVALAAAFALCVIGTAANAVPYSGESFTAAKLTVSSPAKRKQPGKPTRPSKPGKKPAKKQNKKPVSTVPEPSAALVFGVGTLVFGAAIRSRRRN